MSLSTATEQQVFQSVKRACYAGLDSVTLRTELLRRMGRIIPAEASNFSTMDPDTGLISHALGTGFSERLAQAFLGHLYPYDEAAAGIDQAREGRVVEMGTCGEMSTLVRGEGFEHEMRALFFNTEALWGSWCVLRGAGSAPFSDREVRFIERVAPHVVEGLKSAALLELASERDEVEMVEEEPDATATPAFLILDPRGNIVLRTPAAAAYLDDLGSQGARAEDRLPFAILSVRGRLLRRGSVADAAPANARLRARGRSGAWYSLQATLSEPDATGASSIVVSVEPAGRRDIAPLLFRLYGLSPREREVIVWVVRGEPTKRIAHHLGLSTYTVQDYLDKACDKVGVRGRKALIAKLFRDGFAPSRVA